MSRPIPQQCSKCGNAFMGSDCVVFPIICPDCEFHPMTMEEQINDALSWGIRECALEEMRVKKENEELKKLIKIYIKCIDAIGDLTEISDTANQAKAEIQALLK